MGGLAPLGPPFSLLLRFQDFMDFVGFHIRISSGFHRISWISWVSIHFTEWASSKVWNLRTGSDMLAGKASESSRVGQQDPPNMVRKGFSTQPPPSTNVAQHGFRQNMSIRKWPETVSQPNHLLIKKCRPKWFSAKHVRPKWFTTH